MLSEKMLELSISIHQEIFFSFFTHITSKRVKKMQNIGKFLTRLIKTILPIAYPSWKGLFGPQSNETTEKDTFNIDLVHDNCHFMNNNGFYEKHVGYLK